MSISNKIENDINVILGFLLLDHLTGSFHIVVQVSGILSVLWM